MKKNINIPLQKQASMSIQKAFSVIAPVVVYYVVVSMVNTVFAIWFSYLVTQESQKEFVQFLVTYANQASMIVNAIAMTIGGIFLFPVFKSENPVFFLNSLDIFFEKNYNGVNQDTKNSRKERAV